MSSRTKRERKPPARFRPGGSADVPDGVSGMIRDVAAGAVANAKLPISAEAQNALEIALGPAIQAFMTAVAAHAQKKGNGEVTDKDFEAVFNFYKKRSAAERKATSPSKTAGKKAAGKSKK